MDKGDFFWQNISLHVIYFNVESYYLSNGSHMNIYWLRKEELHIVGLMDGLKLIYIVFLVKYLII